MPEPLPVAGLQRDLIPVNAVIGFLNRDRRWPSVLYELGYRLGNGGWRRLHACGSLRSPQSGDKGPKTLKAMSAPAT